MLFVSRVVSGIGIKDGRLVLGFLDPRSRRDNYGDGCVSPFDTGSSARGRGADADMGNLHDRGIGGVPDGVH